MFTVEKDVPLPKGRFGTQGSELRDTLLAMQVGDSFLMPDKTKQGLLSNVAQALGYIVTSRKVSDAERRVWLVSKGEKSTETDQAA